MRLRFRQEVMAVSVVQGIEGYRDVAGLGR